MKRSQRKRLRVRLHGVAFAPFIAKCGGHREPSGHASQNPTNTLRLLFPAVVTTIEIRPGQYDADGSKNR